jgi:hypothetical protein
MAPKNRATFEKLARERRLQERRERKQEKKLAARLAKLAGDPPPSTDDVTSEQPENE